MLTDVRGDVAKHIDNINDMVAAENSKNYLTDYMGELDPTLEKISNETQGVFQKGIEALQKDSWSVAESLLGDSFDTVIRSATMYTPKNNTNRSKRKAPSPKQAKSKAVQTETHKAYEMDYRGNGMIEHVKKLKEDNKALQVKLKKAKESYIGKRDAFLLVTVVIAMTVLAFMFIRGGQL